MSAGRMRTGSEAAARAAGAVQAAGVGGVGAASGAGTGLSGQSGHWGFAGWHRPLPSAPGGCQSGRSPAPGPQRSEADSGWATGVCMLYCRRENVRVLWLGPVHTPSETGEMYGCQSCVAELVHMVGEQKRRLDLEELSGARNGAAASSTAGAAARAARADRSPGQGNPAGHAGR